MRPRGDVERILREAAGRLTEEWVTAEELAEESGLSVNHVASKLFRSHILQNLTVSLDRGLYRRRAKYLREDVVAWKTLKP